MNELTNPQERDRECVIEEGEIRVSHKPKIEEKEEDDREGNEDEDNEDEDNEGQREADVEETEKEKTETEKSYNDTFIDNFTELAKEGEDFFSDPLHS
jgi:hypothetical protein